ncbi:hypothetical protein XENORESO_000025 [Xenotaenia resolanae]|uniref:Uncharacterized protein n=1 Tax=Xenotaenia resolanae TaxID=208358 RepID=A0ABV0WC00_9TELE
MAGPTVVHLTCRKGSTMRIQEDRHGSKILPPPLYFTWTNAKEYIVNARRQGGNVINFNKYSVSNALFPCALFWPPSIHSGCFVTVPITGFSGPIVAFLVRSRGR